MAIGIYFAPTAMSSDKYDQCIKDLRKARAAHGTGRLYYASFGPKDDLMVFDDKFGRTLMAILSPVWA